MKNKKVFIMTHLMDGPSIKDRWIRPITSWVNAIRIFSVSFWHNSKTVFFGFCQFRITIFAFFWQRMFLMYTINIFGSKSGNLKKKNFKIFLIFLKLLPDLKISPKFYYIHMALCVKSSNTEKMKKNIFQLFYYT